jgi:flagellar basal-body rod protein FlgC
MYTAFDVSTSGLVAQRTRLDVISSNLANISTTRNEVGEAVPYTPRFVVFQTDEDTMTTGGGQGVLVDRVEYSSVQPNMKYEPGHPDANADGYVAYPNIDMTTEFVDALGATRAYEANVGVIEATKDMSNRTLQILA